MVGERAKKLGVSGISTLEAQIMKAVWESEPVTVRDVYDQLRKKRRGPDYIPYTTVMSTMTKLANKDLLKQDRSSRAYEYSSTVSPTELAESIIKKVVELILDGDGPVPRISYK